VAWRRQLNANPPPWLLQSNSPAPAAFSPRSRLRRNATAAAPHAECELSRTFLSSRNAVAPGALALGTCPWHNTKNL
jgi:hypothetical protein